MSDWFGFIKEPVDAQLKGLLGDKIGGYLGSQGMGHEIEKWSNPVTQVVNNPILSALKGDYEFGKNETGWMEDTVNNVNELGALLYGGYSAAAGAGGGGASLGGDVTSSTPFAGAGTGGGFDWTSLLNYPRPNMEEDEEGSGNLFTKFFGGR